MSADTERPLSDWFDELADSHLRLPARADAANEALAEMRA